MDDPVVDGGGGDDGDGSPVDTTYDAGVVTFSIDVTSCYDSGCGQSEIGALAQQVTNNLEGLDTVLEVMTAAYTAPFVAAGASAFTLGTATLTTLGVAGGLAVETPFGEELQSLASEALDAIPTVESGATLYRAGNMATSNLTNPQYWSLQNPLTTPGYALTNGMPAATSTFNYIQTGVLQPGGSFITNFATWIGTNTGGALQVVAGSGAVKTCSFIICQ